MSRWYCERCDLYLTNSFSGRQQHMQGKRHQANLYFYLRKYHRKYIYHEAEIKEIWQMFESKRMVGCYARLKDLDRFKKYNGRVVKIVEYLLSKNRFKVRLLPTHTEYFSVRMNNLLLIKDKIKEYLKNVNHETKHLLLVKGYCRKMNKYHIHIPNEIVQYCISFSFWFEE
eukprot:489733_1